MRLSPRALAAAFPAYKLPQERREVRMASPLVDYCEQANPGVLAEIRRLGSAFSSARRIQASCLANLEKKTLFWLAERTPAAINSDHLTLLGFAGQLLAGGFYALS